MIGLYGKLLTLLLMLYQFELLSKMELHVLVEHFEEPLEAIEI